MAKKLLKVAVLGVILGTVAGYLFHPEKGAANREKVKRVSKKLILRVKEELGGLKTVTKKSYDGVVHKVIQDFKEDKTLSKEAWDEVAEHMKARWTDISGDVKTAVKKKVAAVKTKVAAVKTKAAAAKKKVVKKVASKKK